MKDPLVYRLLALANLLFWSLFEARYAWLLFGRGRWRKPVDLFAAILLGIGGAMVIYSIASTLKQVLGDDYIGRDVVRIVASGVFLLCALGGNYVLTRERRRSNR